MQCNDQTPLYQSGWTQHTADIVDRDVPDH